MLVLPLIPYWRNDMTL
uniref:Uncharacterized protein n=1 Tax=Rhizophora mucronata TaxID=61149 RepID=A0A2P2PSF2_RHIMU